MSNYKLVIIRHLQDYRSSLSELSELFPRGSMLGSTNIVPPVNVRVVTVRGSVRNLPEASGAGASIPDIFVWPGIRADVKMMVPLSSVGAIKDGLFFSI